jgi:hypothetical protein
MIPEYQAGFAGDHSPESRQSRLWKEYQAGFAGDHSPESRQSRLWNILRA